MNTILNNRQMKRMGYWLMRLVPIVAVGWLTIGCEEQDLDRTFQGPYFVRFTDSSLTYKESYSPIIPVRVHNAGPILNQPITVNYTISGSAREGKDYSIEGVKGTVVIPANKSFGEIKLKLINNANNILESQSLVFTLTSVEPSSLQVGFGREGVVGKKLTVTIQDDCLLGGTYTGAGVVNGGNASVANIAITSTDCKQYSVSNWNIGLTNLAVVGDNTLFSFNAEKPTLVFIDNGDNSLTVPEQVNTALGDDGALSGTGAWNPRNRQITLNLQAKVRITMIRDTVRTFRDTTLRFTQTYFPQ
ncbi:hypothetical protein [Spirosoma fluminis]